jgi:sodium transport system permease protein
LNFSEIGLCLRKELTEVLRDKRALLVLITLPVLACPLFSLLPALLANQVSQQAATKVTVVCLDGQGSPALKPYFEQSKRCKLVPLVPKWSPENMVISRKCDVVVQTTAAFDNDLKAQKPVSVRIVDSAYAAYMFDEENVAAVLNKFADEQRVIRLAKYKLPAEAERKIDFTIETAETAKQRSAYWTGLTCTLLLILTITVSSMYPALDIITGERERGTLVLLLMAPCNRRNLVIAKLLTVSIITTLAAVLSLISICITLAVLVPKTFDMAGSFTLALPVTNILLSSVFLIPVAIGISACSILISSYAKTFQQGQAYFAPLMIAGMVLCGMALAFDDTAPFFVNYVPLANLMLCMHKAIQGQWNPLAIAATLISSALYLALLLRVSVSILDREEALFGIKQAPGRRLSFTKEAFVLYLSCLAAFFYVSGLLQSISPLWGTLLAQVLTFVAPSVLVPVLLKMPLRQTLSLIRPQATALLGALLIAPGMALLANLIAQWQSSIMPDADAYIKTLQEYIIPKGKDAWLAYITIALGPAICEELLFRGALQGMLRKAFSKPLLCLIVAVLFGILHGSSARFLPTTLMGLVLSAVTEYTGSIFPSMLVHFCNNSLAVYETTSKVPFDMTPPLIIGICLSTLCGIVLLSLAFKHRTAPATTDALP